MDTADYSMYISAMHYPQLIVEHLRHGVAQVTEDWAGLRPADDETRLYVPLTAGGSYDEGGQTHRLAVGQWHMLVANRQRYYHCQQSFGLAFLHVRLGDEHGVDWQHQWQLQRSWPAAASDTAAFTAWCQQPSVRGPTPADGLRNDGLIRSWLASAVGQRRDNDSLLPVLNYMHDHLAEALTAADLAAVAGWTQAHFNRQFTTRFGIAPMAYLRRARLNAARALLTPDGPNLAAIAEQCGFYDAFHFSKSF